jgi:thioredoxin 2
MVSPALEQLARGMAGRLKLVKVNVDDSPRLAERFAVQGIPTLLLMRAGEVVGRQTGAAPERALREWLEQALVASGS